MKALKDSKWMLFKKNKIRPNSNFYTHRPPFGGLSDLENDCTKKFIYLFISYLENAVETLHQLR
jgi:hypothetical protein